MKIIIDSNVVFSAILNTETRIGQLILYGSTFFEFYSIDQLKQEIIFHRKKIIKHLHCTEDQFFKTYNLIISNITFYNEILISDSDLKEAMDLVIDIDEDDTLFVALNNSLRGFLWTGDKKPEKGLLKKGYQNTISTDALYQLYLNEKSKRK